MFKGKLALINIARMDDVVQQNKTKLAMFVYVILLKTFFNFLCYASFEKLSQADVL